MTSKERKRAWQERQKKDPDDDLSERLAVDDALGEMIDRINERLQASDPESNLKFVLGYRAGLQCALAEVDGYRASVRLEREAPTARVRFVA